MSSYAIGAAIGLAPILAASSTAFLMVKYAGALYLVRLGVQALRSRQFTVTTGTPELRSRNIFRDGFVVALLNPKTALFFAAFSQQFLVVDEASVLQSVTLGALFVALAAITDTAHVLVSSAVDPMLARLRAGRAFGRWLTGATLRRR